MFKKTRLVSYVGLVLFFVALSFVVWHVIQNETGFLSLLLYMALCVLFFLLFVGIVGGRINSKMNRRLIQCFENCRPDLMLEGYQKECGTISSASQIRFYNTNLSAAYLTMGQWQAAKEALLGIPLPAKNSMFTTTTMVVKGNLCLCHLALGEMQEAKDCINWLMEQAKSIRMKSASSTMPYKYENKALCLMYFFNIAQGCDEGAESYFTKTWRMETTLLGKVETQYHLGGLYLRRGALAEARAAFEYAAQNGGTTWYAGAAAAQLQQL